MIYDLNVSTYDDKDVSLKTYKGSVLLIVNTAPKCGLVGQYDAIEVLQKEFKDKGFHVLDFPCNQFLNQAPQSDSDIQSFCEINYQTTFTTFKKIDVNGKNAHPIYQYLKKEQPYDMDSNAKYKKFASLFLGKAIKWNFTKFLVDKKGVVRYRFSPSVKPEDMKPYIDLLTKE